MSIPHIDLSLRNLLATPSPSARRKIWDLDWSLHCSVIGTCLSTAELKFVLKKFGALSGNAISDHDLHQMAVAAVGKHDNIAKQINKALDARHRIAINQAAKAKTSDDLKRYWEHALEQTEIPGAYWAVLTHPAATSADAELVFGHVHMLSHLLGAANRADIRRLQELERENIRLEEKAARQEEHLRKSILARDIKIRDLTDAFASKLETDFANKASVAAEGAAIVQLRGALDRETRRRQHAEERLTAVSQAYAEATHKLQLREQELSAAYEELEAAEIGLSELDAREPPPAKHIDLHHKIILYVGGRPQTILRLKSLVEDASGEFIHHDGGIEHAPDLLPALVDRATAIFFPVDCISHNAVATVKRVCRRAGKGFYPLRSSGAASFICALRPAIFGVPKLMAGSIDGITHFGVHLAKDHQRSA